jgi:hypothetical protein
MPDIFCRLINYKEKSMADMYAIFGSLILLGISYPATLTIWWLLFPDRVERSRQRIVETPRKSLSLGLAAAVLAAIPAAIFFTLPSQFTQVLGWIWLVIVLGTASLGATGIAVEIGNRLNQKNNGYFQSWAAFLRGAVILELAAAFPFIGWLLVIPLGTILALGAAVFAVLRWEPKPKLAGETS